MGFGQVSRGLCLQMKRSDGRIQAASRGRTEIFHCVLNAALSRIVSNRPCAGLLTGFAAAIAFVTKRDEKRTNEKLDPVR